MKKWTYVLMTIICVVSMVSLPAGAPPSAVRAQEPGEFKIYVPWIRTTAYIMVPFITFVEPILFDNFEDTDPEWEYRLLKDPKDGFFEHLNGKYAGHIQDNSGLMVASPSPGWRPRGDFKLEVDGRHLDPDKKSFNGLGLAFSADTEWTGFYTMIIAAGAAQHFWAVVRFRQRSSGRDYSATILTNKGYRGGPGSMKNYSGTNHLMVTRIRDTIKPYCNGRALPVGDGDPYVVDATYGPKRQVGLVVTSYEFSYGEVDFDNFRLTPLYEDDIDEYIGEGAEIAPYVFDTPPLNLH
jgi:hypothetical protein